MGAGRIERKGTEEKEGPEVREAGEAREEFGGFSTLPMTGLPLAGAIFGLCLGGPVKHRN